MVKLQVKVMLELDGGLHARANKVADEGLMLAYACSYGLDTVSLRYFNIFGARQDPNGAYAAVIPRWIRAMLVGEEVVRERAVLRRPGRGGVVHHGA